jgi:hypothetical protein
MVRMHTGDFVLDVLEGSGAQVQVWALALYRVPEDSVRGPAAS